LYFRSNYTTNLQPLHNMPLQMTCKGLVKELYNSKMLIVSKIEYLTTIEKILFEKLKQKVASTFLKENSALSHDISAWKGDDIVRFQEDLLVKVKGRVSEKWFYNYFRNDIQKLPRIDMLNLLSEYVGYQNWADFTHQNSPKQQKFITINRKRIIIGLGLALAVFLWIAWSLQQNDSKHVQLCFVDELMSPVSDCKVQLVLANESEKLLIMQDNCVVFDTKLDSMQIKISASNYKNIIINRHLHSDNYHEKIVLQTDLISLLLVHYSNSDTQNWMKRRKKLAKIIDDKAMIYQQWFGNNKGIETYEKDEFIEQLTIPTSLIRNIKILEIAYQDNKIVKLRFRIHPKNKN